MRGLHTILFIVVAACGGSHPAAPIDSTTGGPDAPLTLGTPITAPAGTWTFVPFADATCADGTTTGIGVNLSSASTRVLVYLEGGGACWNALTCYTLMTASNFTTGYGASAFAAESTDASYLAEPGGFFDRTAAANPFKDYSYVYIPYCTGDLHAGNNVAQYGAMTAHHVGFTNMTAYLKRLVPTFPTADRVVLAGSSTGGFGAIYNWWQAQQYFGSVRVDLVDDSGTFMPPDVLAMGTGSADEAAQRTTWNLAATTPPGCTACAQGLDALYPFYAAAFPDHRAALLSYTQDTVLPSFFAISEAQFEAGLTEITTADFDPHPTRRYFLVGTTGHVLFFDPTIATNATTLQSWLGELVTDSAAWANVSP